MSHILIALLFTSIAISNQSIAAEKKSNAPIKKSDEIIFAVGSPQLNNLKIEPVIEIKAPASEAMNGKIIFDENFTARVNSPVAGRAVSIKAQIGDQVKAGQVLMQMDSPDLGSAVSDAKKASADLQLKQQAYERNKMLLSGGVIARKELDNSQAELAEAEAEAQRTRSRLNNLGIKRSSLNNESYSVSSPIDGVIVDRQVNPGSEIRPDANAPLFIITNPEHLWASIDLPERDLGKITQGQSVSITVDAYPNEIFMGKVTSIGVMVDPASRRIPVRCSVESKGKLKPEMYARITALSSNNENVIRLPNSALITEGLYSYVFVESQPGHIKKRRVELNMQEREFSTIKTGLKAGERVVTSGAILLNSELASEQ